MTQKEIQQEVGKCYQIVFDCMAKGDFVLFDKAYEARKRIAELQKICEHNFGKDGFCEFCDIPKEEIE